MNDPAYYAALAVAGTFASTEDEDFDAVPELTPEIDGGWSFEWEYVDGRTYKTTIREAS